MVPSSQAYLLKIHRTAPMYCHQAITSDILTRAHANLCGTETAHMYACCRDVGSAGMCVCYITPAIMHVTIAPD